jgi:ferredoxin
MDWTDHACAGEVFRVRVQASGKHDAGTLAHEREREWDLEQEQEQEDRCTFDAPAGVTLLASALRAGVMLASSCRNGTCRSCMVRLVDGRVRYQIEWPGLLAEEKAEGWILPCVACPESDLVLAPPIDAA